MVVLLYFVGCNVTLDNYPHLPLNAWEGSPFSIEIAALDILPGSIVGGLSAVDNDYECMQQHDV